MNAFAALFASYSVFTTAPHCTVVADAIAIKATHEINTPVPNENRSPHSTRANSDAAGAEYY